jgi:hypothetical protein
MLIEYQIAGAIAGRNHYPTHTSRPALFPLPGFPAEGLVIYEWPRICGMTMIQEWLTYLTPERGSIQK